MTIEYLDILQIQGYEVNSDEELELRVFDDLSATLIIFDRHDGERLCTRQIEARAIKKMHGFLNYICRGEK